MANNYRYKYRNKEYTYEEFVDGPGAKLSTDELNAALDKLSGATKTRRALQRAMTTLGYTIESKGGADEVTFTGNGGTLKFDTFGDVERYLIEKGAIKDEKQIAAEKKAADKEKAAAKKAAAREKEAAKKAAAKEKEAAKKKAAREKEKAAAKKAAVKEKEAAKKAAAKEKEAAKKAAAKEKEAAKKAAAKKAAAKKPGRRPGRPAKVKTETAARKPGRPAKAKTETAAKKPGRRPGRPAKAKTADQPVRRGGRAATAAKKTAARGGRAPKALSSVNLKEDGFVVQMGRKEYTAKRLKNMAIDSYKYDMGGDPKAVKSVQTYLKADEGVCLFVINGKERGEFSV